VSAEREPVFAPEAPAAIGPYSHAVRCGDLLFCSGQIPLDPSSGELVAVSAAAQARRCLENLQAVCAAAGTTLSRAVRLTIYMLDLTSFAEVNEVCEEFFPTRRRRARPLASPPCRAAPASRSTPSSRSERRAGNARRGVNSVG